MPVPIRSNGGEGVPSECEQPLPECERAPLPGAQSLPECERAPLPDAPALPQGEPATHERERALLPGVEALPEGQRALPEHVWLAAESAHQRRLDALLAGHLDRARKGQPHPVEDFLFTYYSFRPAQLRRWHPGAGVVLIGPATRNRLRWPGYRAAGPDGGPARAGASHSGAPHSGALNSGALNSGGLNSGGPDAVVVDPGAFLARRAESVRRIRHLLAATASRPAQLGCFGLHEWAMVHRLEESGRRHQRWPLRLGPERTDAVLETARAHCTHVDAFRFFTPAARALNAVQPTRQTQPELEQPGCLHATMDLYKWAYKLLPAVASELVVDCFVLAREVRELDMRASPYDLRELGYQPVPIETPAGRAQYVAEQREFAARGAALRERLLAACTALLAQA